MLSLFVRRLHDVNKSGWNLLIVIPITAIFAFLVSMFMLSDSSATGNVFLLAYFAIIFGYIYPIYLACKQSVEPNKYGNNIV